MEVSSRFYLNNYQSIHLLYTMIAKKLREIILNNPKAGKFVYLGGGHSEVKNLVGSVEGQVIQGNSVPPVYHSPLMTALLEREDQLLAEKGIPVEIFQEH